MINKCPEDNLYNTQYYEEEIIEKEDDYEEGFEQSVPYLFLFKPYE